MTPCRHHSAYVGNGGWTLEREGPFAGLWVHGDPLCRRPSRATLNRIEETNARRTDV